MIKILDRRIIQLSSAVAVMATPLYYYISYYFNQNLSIDTVLFNAVAAMIATLVGYEIFFKIQDLNRNRKKFVIYASIDEAIPFLPQWVWIYGVVYYFLIFMPISFLGSFYRFAVFMLGGFAVFALAAPIFLVWPTACRPEWRKFPIHSSSARFLNFIQSFDRGSSCFPSLHCALSAYSSVYLHSTLLAIAIPILVALSCLFVKQHSVVEIPLSIAFGWVIGFAFSRIC